MRLLTTTTREDMNRLNAVLASLPPSSLSDAECVELMIEIAVADNEREAAEMMLSLIHI